MRNKKDPTQKKKKLNIYLPYDKELPLIGIYLREMKNMYTKTGTRVFIAALFIITKN